MTGGSVYGSASSAGPLLRLSDQKLVLYPGLRLSFRGPHMHNASHAVKGFECIAFGCSVASKDESLVQRWQKQH